MKLSNADIFAKKVLVVDDELAIRDAIVTYLSLKNISVDSAENGIEALHMLLSREYDLIILDISMPYMDGIELSQAMKDERKTIPILVISAKEIRTPLYQEVDCLVKPFSLKILQDKIETILKK